MYAFGESGQKNFGIEMAFGELETSAATVAHSLRKRKTVSLSDREELAKFTALQLARTPAFRDALAKTYGGYNEREIAEHIQATFKILPPGYDASTFSAIPMSESAMKNFFLGSVLDETLQKAPLFAVRNFRILHAPLDCSFITSSFGLGFAASATDVASINVSHKDVIIYLPLASDLVVEMSGFIPRRKIEQVPHVNVNAFIVREINRRVAYNADQFVVANHSYLRLKEPWGSGYITTSPRLTKTQKAT